MKHTQQATFDSATSVSCLQSNTAIMKPALIDPFCWANHCSWQWKQGQLLGLLLSNRTMEKVRDISHK